MAEITFRDAVPEDAPLILEFIKGIAAYEKKSDQVEVTEELLRKWIFEEGTAHVFFPNA